MMGRATAWIGGLTVSSLLHGTAAMVYVASYDPNPVPDQPVARSQVQLDTVEARRQSAKAQPPPSEAAPETEGDSTALAAGAVRQSRAEPLTAPTTALNGQTLRPAKLSSAAPSIQPLPEARPKTAASPPLTPATAQLSPAAAETSSVPSLDAAAQPAAAMSLDGIALPDAKADIETTAASAPPIEAAQPAQAPATKATAALAWQFGDRLVTDPQALSTIQAFMAPEALDDAQSVRDDLSSLLTSVDCARLSATFLPETGMLEMRGHIPDPSLQGPLLEALRAQMGDGIPVTANLLHLPDPQCGALSGIAAAGLPQSTDQFTNSRLIGASSHARAYNYSEGQRLQFDLTAPDYDAYVYVDYFNAEGEVIHLVPNPHIALEKFVAKSAVGVGRDRPGKPGLKITIGPPYGQEIAVAFAASEQLYDGLRPIVEPADAYLEYLTSRISQARQDHPDFKGEWVYFFITTTPATQ